jgi:hypothetical protein
MVLPWPRGTAEAIGIKPLLTPIHRSILGGPVRSVARTALAQPCLDTSAAARVKGGHGRSRAAAA